MLPANMLGTVTSIVLPNLIRSPFRRNSGNVGVALDRPLESEIDQRGRIDHQFTRHHRVAGRRCLRTEARDRVDKRGFRQSAAWYPGSNQTRNARVSFATCSLCEIPLPDWMI